MKNSFGQNLTVTLFGESHGPVVGAALDGLCPGIPVNEEEIARRLTLRRPQEGIGTARREEDKFTILSGVFNGKTTGAPLVVVIENTSMRSGDYEALRGAARPGHSDYAAFCKYHGYEDYRGGGHFSGRLTAALVAAGAIVLPALETGGILIGSHIKRLAGVEDRAFEDLEQDLAVLSEKSFAVLDGGKAEEMKRKIKEAAEEGDSVGGILEGAVAGLPAGLGEPFFDSVESLLSHAFFSIPGVKGVQFGAGFAGVDKKGSAFNDPFRIQGGRIVTEKNDNGGINGGITNGMPIVYALAVKPTPSVSKTQRTVDFIKNEETEISVGGRHDPAILARVAPVVNALAALVVYDLLLGRFGTDFQGWRR